MRRAASTDANQSVIVDALRDHFYSVTILARVGSGVPDLLVGARGKNILLEVKNGSKLTPEQIEWHATWRGQVAVVDSVEMALKAVEEAIAA